MLLEYLLWGAWGQEAQADEEDRSESCHEPSQRAHNPVGIGGPFLRAYLLEQKKANLRNRKINLEDKLEVEKMELGILNVWSGMIENGTKILNCGSTKGEKIDATEVKETES